MATIECKAAGTVAAAEVAALAELLQGLSGCPPAPVRQHETLLKGPPRERTAPELRLTHYLTTPAGAAAASQAATEPRWSVRHEGAPQRGKAVVELPVTVRSMTVSACSGRAVLPFWRSLGFQPDFELLREGQRYLVLHAGVEMQVTVTRIYRLGKWGDLESAVEVDADRALLEVTATCDDGQQPTAGAAIGSLGELLLPYVQLKKA